MKGNGWDILSDITTNSHASDDEELTHTGPGVPWIFVMIFFLLAGLFLFLMWSPRFSVKNYVVTGTSVVTYEEVVARCVQWSDNIFSLDVKRVEKSLEASPWIEKATCKKKPPDTLEIHIVERIPVAFAPIDGSVWLIDREGRILQKDDGVFEGLVALTGIEGPFAPGQFLDPKKYGWALQIISGVGPLTKSKIIEVNVSMGECTVILDDGCKVFMGEEKTDYATTLALLESILNELEEEGKIAEYIDLRFDKQAVKLR